MHSVMIRAIFINCFMTAALLSSDDNVPTTFTPRSANFVKREEIIEPKKISKFKRKKIRHKK